MYNCDPDHTISAADAFQLERLHRHHPLGNDVAPDLLVKLHSLGIPPAEYAETEVLLRTSDSTPEGDLPQKDLEQLVQGFKLRLSAANLASEDPSYRLLRELFADHSAVRARLAAEASNDRILNTAFGKLLLLSPIAEYSFGNATFRLSTDDESGGEKPLYAWELHRDPAASDEAGALPQHEGTRNYLVLCDDPNIHDDNPPFDLTAERIHCILLHEYDEDDHDRYTVLSFADKWGSSVVLRRTQHSLSFPSQESLSGNNEPTHSSLTIKAASYDSTKSFQQSVAESVLTTIEALYPDCPGSAKLRSVVEILCGKLHEWDAGIAEQVLKEVSQFIRVFSILKTEADPFVSEQLIDCASYTIWLCRRSCEELIKRNPSCATGRSRASDIAQVAEWLTKERPPTEWDEPKLDCLRQIRQLQIGRLVDEALDIYREVFPDTPDPEQPSSLQLA